MHLYLREDDGWYYFCSCWCCSVLCSWRECSVSDGTYCLKYTFFPKRNVSLVWEVCFIILLTFPFCHVLSHSHSTVPLVFLSLFCLFVSICTLPFFVCLKLNNMGTHKVLYFMCSHIVWAKGMIIPRLQCVCVCVRACMHACVCVHACMCVCMHACACVRMCVYISFCCK